MKTDLVLGREYFSDLDFNRVLTVNVIDFKTKKDFLRKVNNERDLVVVEGSKNNRAVLENKKVDLLLSPEKGVKRDSLHYRNSGLNHVLCKLAKKNDIAIGFSFNDVLLSNGERRAKILGRMMQNVSLCRKYKLKMVIGSFAKDRWQMRKSTDLISFGVCLGMHPEEAKKALEEISFIIKKKEERKSFVAEGVREV